MPNLDPPIPDPDIRTVQEQLGHRDVKTTMIYTYVLNRPRCRSDLQKLFRGEALAASLVGGLGGSATYPR